MTGSHIFDEKSHISAKIDDICPKIEYCNASPAIDVDVSASKRVSVPDDQQSSKYARRDTRPRGRTHRPSLSAWFDRGMEVQEPEDIDKEKEADASNVSPREDDIDGHLVLPSDATAYVEGSSEGPPFISDHEEAVSEGELQEGRDHAEDILSEDDTAADKERETDCEPGIDDLGNDRTTCREESICDSTEERERSEIEQESTHGEGQHERYELLYEGCPIREDQSIILISLFAARHHLSDVAIKDLLKLIDLHCPSPNNCTKSGYR